MNRDKLIEKLLLVEPALTMAQIAVIEEVTAKHYEQVALEAVKRIEEDPIQEEDSFIGGKYKALESITKSFGWEMI